MLFYYIFKNAEGLNRKTMNLKEIKINELKVGDTLINLGQVLEIEEKSDYLFIVISRHNEKQVFKFSPIENLVILA
jgi:hypothetical protein